MNKIQVHALGVSATKHDSDVWVLLLGELYGKRRIPIMIGRPEAQSIAAGLHRVPTKRPLIHDVVTQTLNYFQITLKEIYIYRLENDIFFTQLLLEQAGKEFSTELRTSDAIAVAVRTNCPIYADESVLDFTHHFFDDKPSSATTTETRQQLNVSDASMIELQQALKIAAENEDYELAAKLRDEIKKRES